MFKIKVRHEALGLSFRVKLCGYGLGLKTNYHHFNPL